MTIIYGFIIDPALILETITQNIYDGDADDIALVSESIVNSGAVLSSPSDPIYAVDVVSSGGNIFFRDVTDTGTFDDEAVPNAHLSDITQYQVAYDFAEYGNPGEDVTVTDTLTAEVAKSIVETQVINETVTNNKIMFRDITETAAVAETVGSINNRICEPYTQTNTGSVIFTATPYTVTLPTPEFDNGEEFDWNRVIGQTRGLDLIVYRNDQWPSTQTLAYTWNKLKESDKVALVNFLKQTVGRVVTLTDYENRMLQGVIINPDTEFVQSTRNYYTVSVRFEI